MSILQRAIIIISFALTFAGGYILAHPLPPPLRPVTTPYYWELRTRTPPSALTPIPYPPPR
jgi:hypothetical protein